MFKLVFGPQPPHQQTGNGFFLCKIFVRTEGKNERYASSTEWVLNKCALFMGHINVSTSLLLLRLMYTSLVS